MMRYALLTKEIFETWGAWLAKSCLPILFLMAQSMPANTQPAQGHDNPTLAFGLSRVVDYSAGLQFLDLTRTMNPWKAIIRKPRSVFKWVDLNSQGFLDKSGWPTKIPDGYDELFTSWRYNADHGEFTPYQGRFVLTYKGAGKIKLRFGGKIVSQAPGKIVFENIKGRQFAVSILETDPSGTGDYIRDISIVAERHLDLHNAGAVFDPDWLNLIKDARQLRFMDWGHTNNSSQQHWVDRGRPNGPYEGKAAVEYMVRLANEVGAEPWFNIPHMADETYVRNFAIYVRDHMDPSLPIRVEYSNEVWNWGFKQSKHALKQANARWGSKDQAAYHSKLAVQNALIWDDVFADEPDARLIHVFGAQAVNLWRSEVALAAKAWKENEPNQYIAPATVFDELAITHYFGGFTMRDADAQRALLSVIKDPSKDAFDYLAAKLRDPNFGSSLAYTAQRWREHAVLAHKHGLKLTAYEGGQHVHHRGNTKTLSEADTERLRAFMIEFVRSPQMAALYAESWRLWSEIADGPFMQFGEITTPSKYGSWGVYEGLFSPTRRGDVLNSLNKSQKPWWPTSPSPSFQHGVTTYSGSGDDTLRGTIQEDYLIAGAGNDVIIESLGDDGVNGGAGLDRVVLAAKISDYILRPKGKGIAIIGPQGSDYYYDVEEIEFAGGYVVTLSTLPLGSDGNYVVGTP